MTQAIAPPLPTRLLVVEDSAVQAKRVRYVLESEGYQVTVAVNGRDGLAAAAAEQPALVISDVRMPEMSGYEMCAALKAEPALRHIPVVLLTSLSDPRDIIRGLQAGADSFISKPYNDDHLLARLEYLLLNRTPQRGGDPPVAALEIVFQGAKYEITAERQQILNLLLSVFEAAVQKNGDLIEAEDELRALNESLEEKVRDRTRQVEEARLETLQRLARTAEYRDDNTGQHTRRVGLLAARIGRQLGLDEPHTQLLAQAAPLHDVGKVAISDTILLKPGKLTVEEFDIMKTHTVIGASILEGSSSAVLGLAERIARSHHERWNGTGYPDGLAGESIPIEARIVAVADVFDGLTHERPYKAAWPVAQAVEELQRMSGSHLDPQVFAGFLACHGELLMPGPERAEE